MDTQKHPFQQWAERNGILDVHFFPANPSSSAPTELLDEAHRAVVAHEKGKTVPYEDNVSNLHLDIEHGTAAAFANDTWPANCRPIFKREPT